MLYYLLSCTKIFHESRLRHQFLQVDAELLGDDREQVAKDKFLGCEVGLFCCYYRANGRSDKMPNRCVIGRYLGAESIHPIVQQYRHQRTEWNRDHPHLKRQKAAWYDEKQNDKRNREGVGLAFQLESSKSPRLLGLNCAQHALRCDTGISSASSVLGRIRKSAEPSDARMTVRNS